MNGQWLLLQTFKRALSIAFGAALAALMRTFVTAWTFAPAAQVQRHVQSDRQSRGGGGGAMTSRPPLDCNGPTTPLDSICSSMRAARL
jgi:hypothetical protein